MYMYIYIYGISIYLQYSKTKTTTLSVARSSMPGPLPQGTTRVKNLLHPFAIYSTRMLWAGHTLANHEPLTPKCILKVSSPIPYIISPTHYAKCFCRNHKLIMGMVRLVHKRNTLIHKKKIYICICIFIQRFGLVGTRGIYALRNLQCIYKDLVHIIL